MYEDGAVLNRERWLPKYDGNQRIVTVFVGLVAGSVLSDGE